MSDLRHRMSRQVAIRFTRPGAEAVPIDLVISPLRYDVVVRQRLFDLLDDLKDEGDDAAVRAAAASDYWLWFVKVESARFFRNRLADPAVLSTRFRERVIGARRVLESFEHQGFNPANPLVLVRAGRRTRTDSGAPVVSSLQIADGCHRLALLRRRVTHLEPHMYQVRPAVAPLPDNTAILRRHGVIAEQDYAAFLARSMLAVGRSGPRGRMEPADPHVLSEVADVDSLRRLVAAAHPERVHLLESIIATHSRAGADPSQSGVPTFQENA